ncbi:MAG: hypothetical protein AAGJ37_00575 [Pseudomonadota bacterium]
MHQTLSENVLDYTCKEIVEVYLLVDDETDVAIGEKPIFGHHVTIDKHLLERKGRMLPANTVLGWLNYISLSKFGCINKEKKYVDASNYFGVKHNFLVLRHPAELMEIDTKMQASKQLLKFRFAKTITPHTP